MDDGQRILEWARQNQHTLTWVAERIGYSRQLLSQALHHNRISPGLADALFEHFSLLVQPTRGTKTPRTKEREAPRNGASSASKLDPHHDDIERLLVQGVTQRYIARRFGTSDSNLSQWIRKRELRRGVRDV